MFFLMDNILKILSSGLCCLKGNHYELSASWLRDRYLWTKEASDTSFFNGDWKLMSFNNIHPSLADDIPTATRLFEIYVQKTKETMKDEQLLLMN